jgi:hypothetical protein
MKSRLNLRTIILGSGLLIASLSSCKKADDTAVTADSQAAQDNSYAEAIYSDAFNAVDVAATTNTSVFKTSEATLEMLSGGSVTITIDSTSNAKRLTIDFGTSTVCKDGKTRSGQIIATWTGRYRQTGSVTTITFNNYYVNGNHIEGTKTVTNQGLNANGNIHFSILVAGAKITTTNGVISWESTRDREWVAGSNTKDINDDVYNITGTASGTNIKGVSYTIVITKPLVINLSCRFIEAGTFTITTSNSTSTGVVDFGPGTCDDAATFTANGKTYDFHMR